MENIYYARQKVLNSFEDKESIEDVLFVLWRIDNSYDIGSYLIPYENLDSNKEISNLELYNFVKPQVLNNLVPTLLNKTFFSKSLIKTDGIIKVFLFSLNILKELDSCLEIDFESASITKTVRDYYGNILEINPKEKIGQFY